MTHLTLKQITIILASLLLGLGVVISAGLFYLTEDTDEVAASWHAYQSEYSEKVRLKGALEETLGYGGMIHDFKNLVLRQDMHKVEHISDHIAAAQQMIKQYSQLVLSSAEQTALQDISRVLAEYRQKLKLVRHAVLEGEDAKHLDQLVRVDDSYAFRALATLENINDEQGVRLNESLLSKAQYLSQLRANMGYGGMIHSFKNYVLRNDPRYLENFQITSDKALNAIKAYRDKGVGSAESLALNDISQTIGEYAENLSLVKREHAEGKEIEEIDRIVKVDDALALRGLSLLTTETNAQIRQHEQHLSQSLLKMQRFEHGLLWMLVVLILLILAVSIWLINSRIRSPFTHMVGVMDSLSKGDTTLDITPSAGENELGRMVKSLHVFRDEMIRRERSDQALQQANEELNHQLHELTVIRQHSDEQATKAIALAEGLAQARDEALAATKLAEGEKARAEAMVNAVSDAVITINERGEILSFNPAAEEIFGYRSSEVMNLNVSCLMPEPYSSAHDSYLARFLETGQGKILGSESKESMARRRELVGLHKDGSVFDIELSIGMSMIEGDRMFTGVVRDISRQKKLEAMKHEFVSTVSHELRTPLTAMKGSLGLLQSGVLGVELEGDAKRMMDVTVRNVERLAELVNDILDIEKLDAGEIVMNLEPVAVNEILNDAIEVNRHYAAANQVEFEIEQNLEAMVHADATRIAQVMANLMSNAAKFSPEGETVTIGAKRVSEMIRIYVSDVGPGIPESFRERIFERFTQADSTDVRQQGGTGLGMAISKAIVEKHGGHIGFDSIMGQGSTFYFELPEAKDN